MFIPNLTESPAYRQYIFKLKKFRLCIINDEGELLVLDHRSFVFEKDWSGDKVFSNIEVIRLIVEGAQAAPEGLFIQGDIDGKWVTLKLVEIIYELQHV